MLIRLETFSILATSCLLISSSCLSQVLVDAECTHDGSLKHIQKYDWWGWDSFERRVMDPQRLASITDLQVTYLPDSSFT